MHTSSHITRIVSVLSRNQKTPGAVLALILVLAPWMAHAQLTTPTTLGQLYLRIISILTAFVPVLIGASLLVFLYGLIKYITAGDDAKGRGEAVTYIIWSLFGLFVMLSVWGLVGILTGTFGFSNGGGGVTTLPGDGGGGGTNNPPIPAPPGGI